MFQVQSTLLPISTSSSIAYGSIRLSFPVTWSSLSDTGTDSDRWEMVVPRMIRPAKPLLPQSGEVFVPSLSVLNDSWLDRMKRAVAKVR